MTTLYRFDEIERSINKYLEKVKNSDQEEKTEAIFEYLKHIEELYSEGSIGYAIFPNRVLTVADNNIEDMKLNEIFELAVKLDLPNGHLEPNLDRNEETKKLQNLIKAYHPLKASSRNNNT